jgi:hypothetical protein
MLNVLMGLIFKKTLEWQNPLMSTQAAISLKSA